MHATERKKNYWRTMAAASTNAGYTYASTEPSRAKTIQAVTIKLLFFHILLQSSRYFYAFFLSCCCCFSLFFPLIPVVTSWTNRMWRIKRKIKWTDVMFLLFFIWNVRRFSLLYFETISIFSSNNFELLPFHSAADDCNM